MTLFGRPRRELGPGAVHLPGWLDLPGQRRLVQAFAHWSAGPVPVRAAVLPGGHAMSVRTVCLGWHWQPYRYSRTADDVNGARVPDFPDWLAELGRRVVAEAYDEAAAAAYRPDTALVNWYDPGARMGMHQDKDEVADDPVVSLSVGDSCVFRFGNPHGPRPAVHGRDAGLGGRGGLRPGEPVRLPRGAEDPARHRRPGDRPDRGPDQPHDAGHRSGREWTACALRSRSSVPAPPACCCPTCWPRTGSTRWWSRPAPATTSSPGSGPASWRAPASSCSTRWGSASGCTREGDHHRGIHLQWPGERHHLDFVDLVGRGVWVYGQTEVQKDLGRARDAAGQRIVYEVADTAVHDVTRPSTRDVHCGRSARSGWTPRWWSAATARSGRAGPRSRRRCTSTWTRTYPYSWLGILADVAPSTDELIYAWHPNGFALHSMRSATVSRLYLQVPNETDVADWPDDRIWAELAVRIGPDAGPPGPITEKSVLPMRSYVLAPMRHGRLFLAGDAAHIVPPTGAKGLNLAISDVALLAPALTALLREDDPRPADAYSDTRPAPGLAVHPLLLVDDHDAAPRRRRRSTPSCSCPSCAGWSAARPARPGWPRTTPACRSATEPARRWRPGRSPASVAAGSPSATGGRRRGCPRRR